MWSEGNRCVTHAKQGSLFPSCPVRQGTLLGGLWPALRTLIKLTSKLYAISQKIAVSGHIFFLLSFLRPGRGFRPLVYTLSTPEEPCFLSPFPRSFKKCPKPGVLSAQFQALYANITFLVCAITKVLFKMSDCLQ